MKSFSKIAFILGILILICNSNLLAQEGPDTLWTKAYGGSDDDYGWAVQEVNDGGYIVIGSSLIKTDTNGDTLWVKSIQGFSGQQTSDGGYIVAGCIRSNSHYTLQLTKVDINGGIVWLKKFEDVELGIGRSVDQTMDGGYIVTGNTKGGICLIKTDYNGDSVWVNTYGHGKSYSVRQTSDRGYIITGGTCDVHGGSRVFLIKTDNYSQTLWIKTYGLGFKSLGYSVLQTRDGGYVIVGNSQIDDDNMNDADIYLIKTDSLGDTLWTKTYGGIYWDVGQSVQQTSDSGYIIIGMTTSFSGNPQVPNVYLIKTDVNGDTIWTKTYAGSDGAYGSSVQQTSDGGYIIAGYTMAIGSDNWDVYLIKTDVNGDTIWTRIYGGDTTDVAHSVQQTIDQGYIVAGYTKSFGMGNSNDVWLLKVDSLGDTLWTKTYGGMNTDLGHSVQQTSDHGYIVVGYTFSWGADSGDIYLVKTDSLGDTLWTQTYGGVATEIGNFVQQTLDNGYIIVGSKGSYSAENLDVYLIKTDADGDTLWTKTYGGARNDFGWEVREISNEGYIIAGHTESFSGGYQEVYILRTDSNGDILWTKIFGGGIQDEAFSISLTSDDGYIIAGRTWSFGTGGIDVYLISTAGNGDTLWTKTYGGTADDGGWSVQQTSDGGYIITGATNSFGAGADDVYLIKTNANGDTLWTKTYGGTSADGGFSVQQTSDSGYIIAGVTNSFGVDNFDVYLIKTDANGNTLWTKTYGGTDDDWGWSVQQSTDGGYIVAGHTYSFGAGTYDVYLIKTDANGDTLWVKTYGGTNWDVSRSVQQTTDGGYIIAGYTNSFGPGDFDVYLIKTDANGDTLWTKTCGGSADDGGVSVQQTNDGGYIIAGGTDSFGDDDVYLIKTNANGDTLWTETYGGTDDDWGWSVQETTDGGYIVAGHTYLFGAGGYDVYLIKTRPDTFNIDEEINVIKKVKDLPATMISGPLLLPEGKNCRVFDITGRVMMPDKIKPGVYFIEVDGKITQKVIKIK